jgi:hypothetical protein
MPKVSTVFEWEGRQYIQYHPIIHIVIQYLLWLKTNFSGISYASPDPDRDIHHIDQRAHDKRWLKKYILIE